MKYIYLLCTLFFLAACSSLLTSKDNIHFFYVLNPIGETREIERPANLRLDILRPIIPGWLDTQQIILRRRENKVDYYADARWVEKAGDMLGVAITQSLINNNVAKNILYAAPETQADYLLVVEVLAFQANYDNPKQPPMVEVALQGKLISMPDNKLHYRFTTKHTTPASRDQLTDIIHAFDTSLENCLLDLVDYTHKAL